MIGKQTISWVIFALILALAAGGTTAYFISKYENVDVSNTVKSVSIKVIEEAGAEASPDDATYAAAAVKNSNTIEKNVWIQSVDDPSEEGVPIYIRARLLTEWKDLSGNNTGIATDNISFNFTNAQGPQGGSWVEKADSSGDTYYYYTAMVSPGEKTAQLISSIYLKDDTVPEGVRLEVEVIADAVEASAEVVDKKWGVGITIDENGNLIL